MASKKTVRDVEIRRFLAAAFELDVPPSLAHFALSNGSLSCARACIVLLILNRLSLPMYMHAYNKQSSQTTI